MELKSTWNNDQAIFHAFTDAEVNKKSNMLYKEFEERCSYVHGCTNNPISYLMRKNLVPKYEADNPKEDYVTLDLQIVLRATIVKADNANYVNLENSGSRAREAHANADNSRLFKIAKTEFGETSLCVHAKPSQRSRNQRQALKLIWYT